MFVVGESRMGRKLCGLILIAMATLSSACGTNPDVQGSYKPPLLPVKFVMSGTGVSINGDKSLVTPLGTFSIGAKYSLPAQGADHIYVIIRSRKEGDAGFDRIYDVKSGQGEFTAVVNGRTTIQVRDRKVLIDVTDGSVESIELKGVETQPTAETESDNMLSIALARWNGYWDSAFYTPLSLFRWAYDDSTMSDWYGLGFAWFLIRLVFALILFIGDVLLTIACFLAAVATVLFGTTGRNIVYGIEALIVLLIIGTIAIQAFNPY